MWVGWVHHSRRLGHAEALCEVGPEMPERILKTSMVSVIWANFGILLAGSKWFPVAIGDHGQNLVISLWPRVKATSMEWRHSSSPHPKKFRVQKSVGKVLALIFWDQDSILLIDYVPNGQTTRSTTHLCWCNWRTFWRKNAAGRSPRGSCSCTTMPQLTGHLQPRRNWPTWASNVLITHPILRIWPCWTTTCSLDRKNNWKVAIFRPTRRSLLLWRPGWMDNFLNFFWVACKSYSNGLRSVLSFVGSMLNKSWVWWL